MADDGWVKLHRCLLDSLVWTSSNSKQRDILINLLLMANHKENDWIWEGKRYSVGPGQFITSLDSIMAKCSKDVTIQNIRTALVHFEKVGFLTNKSTNRGRLITIVNWSLYQGEEGQANKQVNRHLTSNQQAANKQLTTNNNDKNDKNEKNNSRATKKAFIPPTLEEVIAYAKERGRPDLAKKFFDYYEAPEDPKDKWVKANGKPVNAWKQQFITWEGFNGQTPYRAPDKPEVRIASASFRKLEDEKPSALYTEAPPEIREKLRALMGKGGE